MLSHSEIKNKIIDAIREVYDPEIPVNIYEMGLVYNVDVDDNGVATILMTLTAPNCPEAETLPNMVKNTIMSNVKELTDVKVDITFEPPWSPEKMSTAAKLALDMIY